MFSVHAPRNYIERDHLFKTNTYATLIQDMNSKGIKTELTTLLIRETHICVCVRVCMCMYVCISELYIILDYYVIPPSLCI